MRSAKATWELKAGGQCLMGYLRWGGDKKKQKKWLYDIHDISSWDDIVLYLYVNIFQEISNRTHWTDPETWVSHSSIATSLGVRW